MPCDPDGKRVNADKASAVPVLHPSPGIANSALAHSLRGFELEEAAGRRQIRILKGD
jgi:hypothetical protein